VQAGGALAVSPDPARLGAAMRELLRGNLGEIGARLHNLVVRDYAWDAAVRRYAVLFARVTR